ncbi:acyl-CoA dehydrogenase family protein [Pararobbsia silviterrae]|uniref:Pimeloyl-CoA dehydrogenase small subunit n=1 Tax=Pararobbsia silviterrae TaxID=1792498 RepID=A0A494XKV0_9BURK|nr:acyl-CoA dehydrogenase [Pararobbsia silviterrae]RKP50361.1 pimeloyl-CoA dehydrogenase small subunit [Pararobbsia silviterrae]
MNFEHTEERRMLADTLDRFVSEAYGFDVRDKAAKSAIGFDRAAWDKFVELGTVAALFSEADGGFGGEGFDITVVFESLGRGIVVEPFLGALVVGSVLAAAGGEAHAGTLEQIQAGTAIVALAHDEPGSHYEAVNVRTRAERSGDGWVLTGAKSAVAHGEQADFVLVSARTSGDALDEDGVSLFLVPKSAAGVHAVGYARVDGGRAADLRFDGVKLDAHARVGEAGAGYAVLEYAIARGTLAVCAEALGAMEVVKRDTLEYLRTRKQFGVPIGSFQALQHRMADLLIDIEQARSAVINAAASLNLDRVARERAVSAAKYTIGRTGTRVAEECIQLHGGIGMTWELATSHYAKRLVMIDHQFGDQDHHLERYIGFGRA